MDFIQRDAASIIKDMSGSAAEQYLNLTVEEYFELEEASEIRHEYFGGYVVAMAGASDRHNIISLNLAVAIRAHLRGGPCQVFIHDMKVLLSVMDQDWFYYPDLFVACNPADKHPLYRTEPKLIIEVLSPSNESKDKIEKFIAYGKNPAIEEYVIIDQNPAKANPVWVFRSQDWKEQSKPTEVLELASIGLSIPFAQIYEGIG